MAQQIENAKSLPKACDGRASALNVYLQCTFEGGQPLVGNWAVWCWHLASLHLH